MRCGPRPSWRRRGGPDQGRELADAQDIPLQFLEHILLELKHAGIVRARRGAKGGYWLAKPAEEVTIADVVRAVEGPIAHVQSAPPESIEYRGNAEHLQEVWIAVRASLRTVLEHVTLADLVSGGAAQRGRAARRRSPTPGSPASQIPGVIKKRGSEPEGRVLVGDKHKGIARDPVVPAGSCPR